MLCIPLTSLDEVPKSTMVEFRLDLFKKLDVAELGRIRKKIKAPVLFTGDASLAYLEPDYLDFDHKNPEQAHEVRKQFPAIKIVISYHNYEMTPDLDAVYSELKKHPGDIFKIACLANSSCDAMRMLLFVKHHAPLLGLCMGEWGEVTRILGPILGSPWTFAALSDEKKTADGQLTVEEMAIYDLKRLSKNAEIYALIGGDLKKRQSHRYHNHVMKELGLDAIHMKIPVVASELQEFFSLAKKIGFRGFSVTDPLKEHVIPFLDEITPEAEEIGAVNTISIRNGKLFGSNTDGKGALNAVEQRMKVRGKKVIVLGAGGAAKAIIYEALQRGAEVVVLNRTPKMLKWNVCLRPLDEMEACDILINTTPVTVPNIPKCLAMDISLKPLTPFLQDAKKSDCETISGMEMWVNLTALQYQIWRSDLNLDKIFTILQKIT